MKGFFRWFKSNTKMKRWMILILIGIVLSCYGMAEVLIGKKLDFIQLLKIILSFVFGFVFVIVGIVHIQKRTLELLVQETDERVKKDTAKVNTLIYNKKVFDQGPKIVAIGGGTGLNAVLKGLKKYTDNLTAIVTVSDYGELVSNSSQILGMQPLNDIKGCYVALANNEEKMNELMEYKFKQGRLQDLSFGDIFLLGMQNISGSFSNSIEQTKEVLNITGKVLPVTLEPIKICVELEDGTVIENRNKIPDEVASTISKINRVFITPTNCKVAPGVLEAIQEADAIVIGPGNLYTNVIPNLLVNGVSKAIKESKAFKIYVSNLMTKPGQTDDYSLSEHIKAIVEHVGKGVIDYCIYDTGELVPEYIRKYNMQGQELVNIDTNKIKEQGIYLMQRNISYVKDEYIRHNPDAIAASIIQLICDDLKFKDMQNDTKYVLLNDRLKNAKKDLKDSKRNDNFRKTKKKEKLGQSKFFKKYQDRIESIRESEIKLKEKEKIAKKEQEEKGQIKQNITNIEVNTNNSNKNNFKKKKKHKKHHNN